MPTTSPTSLAPTGNATRTAASAAPSTAFDGEAFMKLLMAQLKHQDPMNPMKDQEFMGQLAQMNTLAEMQKLNKNIEAMSRTQSLVQGASLIGKMVQAQDATGQQVRGIVGSVRLMGAVVLDIGGATAKLSDVQTVQEGFYA